MTVRNDTDPRLESQYLQSIERAGEAGTVTLVGVVHDHPASAYRARRVVADRRPDVVALELPPLAVPLYEAYADGDATSPALGGEFRAAVEAAETDDTVGVDGPSRGFARALVDCLRRDGASARDGVRALRSLVSVTGTTLACRVAATVTRRTPITLEVGSPTAHGTAWFDSPAEQAADERSQIRTATAVMDAFEGPATADYLSRARERHMADRIETLRQRGDVVAIVGAGHFDALCDRLAGD